MFSHWTTFSLINILTSQQSHGSCWEILWAARAQERGLYCIQVAVKKKKKEMLAASKCPIKCKWHLQGWTGSVHLSVDQSCTRSTSTSQFIVTLLQFVFFFFFFCLYRQCQNTLWLSGGQQDKDQNREDHQETPGRGVEVQYEEVPPKREAQIDGKGPIKPTTMMCKTAPRYKTTLNNK